MGDPGNDAVLRAVAEGCGSAPALAARTGRPRVALWETVSDLVQAGLLERDPSRDGVTLTRAGGATLGLVDHLVSAGGVRP
jgi:DNA-binding IclR family transcriptional regulator